MVAKEKGRAVTHNLLALVTMGVAMSGLACAHPTPRTAPAPERLPEEHCWWAVMRSTLPHDSVAARFARAFTAAGLPQVAVQRAGDTTWVTTGTAPLPAGLQPNASPTARYATRVVTYQRGDSTRWRQFVGHTPGVNVIGACAQLQKGAAVGALALSEPDGEETLPVWQRR